MVCAASECHWTSFNLISSFLLTEQRNAAWSGVDYASIHGRGKSEVDNLQAEPDFRSVKLKWYYSHSPEPLGFKIRFCEVSIWNTKVRCREKKLPLLSSRVAESRALIKNRKETTDNLIKTGARNYEAYIYDLRTMTNYSFNVKADLSRQFQNRPQFVSSIYNKPMSPSYSSFFDSLKTVVVETKGFSAKTTLCLANVSDVLVNTGPYFGGKVAVENATDERCAVYGNRSDSRDVYKLTIIHDICGSKIIDNSRIESMIMVHENKEILTHNSRRYLVVCNFVPETYTIQASVDLPPHLLKRKKSEEKHRDIEEVTKSTVAAKDNGANHIFTYEKYKHNNVRDSRMLANQQHKLLDYVKQPKVGIVGLFTITLLSYFTLPNISSARLISTDVHRNTTKSEIDANQIRITFSRSPVSLVSMKSYGESSA
ncbi:hypothetical protein B4U80_02042 [Leptotrombidium deliense]|uniref:ZP domain-containing protein n=1 Tax=Leptotrombidium deliense TaxID=299467 RepID=A0A443SKS5_9ACAR|nr:hypothetical protein B4U80_02042 [Leptotrombidium deliense]